MNTNFSRTGSLESSSDSAWFPTLEFDEFDFAAATDELEAETRRRRPNRSRRAVRRPSRTKPLTRPPGHRRYGSRPGPDRPPIRPRPHRPVVIRQPAASCTCPAHKTEFVRWLQSSLNQILGLRLRVSGVMNSTTREALRDFQQREGLPVDGIAGPETEKALIEARARTGSDPLNRPGPQVPEEELDIDLDLSHLELEEEVQRNSRAYIRWVQNSLNKIMGSRLAVDGISGTMTRSAVRSFQARQDLVVDGIVGPQTEQALIAAGAKHPPGMTTPSYPTPRTTTNGNSRVQLAAQILASNRIELWPYSPTGGNSTDGADAFSNIRDTAQGRSAKRSNYENAPAGSVYLDTRLLNGILSLSKTYSLAITSIAGGSHSVGSRHYAGIACDVGAINNLGVSSSNPYVTEFMQKCRALGADEVLGPGSAGHDRHVHLAWPRP